MGHQIYFGDLQVTTERSVTLSILLVRRLFLPAQTITAPDLPPQPALRFCQTVRLYTNKEYNPHFNFNEKQLILFGEVILVSGSGRVRSRQIQFRHSTSITY
jgi:hypothetical protein